MLASKDTEAVQEVFLGFAGLFGIPDPVHFSYPIFLKVEFAGWRVPIWCLMTCVYLSVPCISPVMTVSHLLKMWDFSSSQSSAALQVYLLAVSILLWL